MGQRLSASRLGLAFECLHSFSDACELPPEALSRYAASGHGLADWQAKIINGQAAAEEAPERVRNWFGSWREIAPGEARAEVALAYCPETGKARELGLDLGRRYREAGLRDDEIPMTADVAGRDGDCAVITDTKGGPGEQWIRRVTGADKNRQIGALAVAWANVLGVSRARVELHHVDETGSIRRDLATLDTLDLAAIELDIQELWAKLQRGRFKAHAGTHCVDLHCPALSVCPAAQEQAAKLIPIDRLASAIERNPGAAVVQFELASRLMDRWHDGLKRYVDAHGSIPISEEWEFAKRVVSVKPETKLRSGYTKTEYRRLRRKSA